MCLGAHGNIEVHVLVPVKKSAKKLVKKPVFYKSSNKGIKMNYIKTIKPIVYVYMFILIKFGRHIGDLFEFNDNIMIIFINFRGFFYIY